MNKPLKRASSVNSVRSKASTALFIEPWSNEFTETSVMGTITSFESFTQIKDVKKIGIQNTKNRKRHLTEEKHKKMKKKKLN